MTRNPVHGKEKRRKERKEKEKKTNLRVNLVIT